MARKKKPASRRKGKGGVGRTIKVVLLSAAVSFAAGSWTLNPSLLDELDLGRILAEFDLGPLWGDQYAAPVAAPVNGYVSTSFAQCPQFFPGDPPLVPAAQALRELCFTSFAILHSGQAKTPVFVVQRLNRRMLVAAQKVSRNDRFHEEARLPSVERAKLSDYRGSGFDRGHMAPAGDMHNDEAMAQSFSLANVVPQNAVHNQGAWNKVEQDTRKYILRAKGDVYVFTGPVFADRSQTIGEGRVAVPGYLYKVVYDATTGRSWVHWHVNSAKAQAGTPISYKEFLRRTGLRFLASPR